MINLLGVIINHLMCIFAQRPVSRNKSNEMKKTVILIVFIDKPDEDTKSEADEISAHAPAWLDALLQILRHVLGSRFSQISC